MFLYENNKKIENIIFEEVSEPKRWNQDEKILHTRLVELLTKELIEYISIEKILIELKNNGVLDVLTISEIDLKKIAINNFVKEIVKENRETINYSNTLTPLLHFDFDEIKYVDYQYILNKLKPQIKEMINIPLENRIKKLVNASLKDGKLFNKLIQYENEGIKEEQEGENDIVYINYFKKIRGIFQKYSQGEYLNKLINDTINKIKEAELLDFSYSEMDDYPVLKKDIEKSSKRIQLTIEDIKNYIQTNNNYCSITHIIQKDEFLNLMKQSLNLKNQKTKDKQYIHTLKK